MSDPYLDKLHEQRAKWVSEMPNCAACLANPNSRTPIVDYIWLHSTREETTPESDANIEYDHDAPSEHYAYKSKGMTDGDKMSPARWREPAEVMPGEYRKDKAK